MIGVLGALGWGLLATGAITHLWHHDRLRELLRMHTDRDRALAAVLLAIEIGLSLALAAAVVADAAWLRAGAAVAALVGVGFTLWILRLLVTNSTLPCACSFSEAPPSIWSLVRAAGVVLIVGLGFIGVDPTVAERVALLLVGLAAGVALFLVPDALAWPTASTAQLARLDSHRPINRERTEEAVR